MTTREFTDQWITALSERYDAREAKEILRIWLEDSAGIERSKWIMLDSVPSDLNYIHDMERLKNGEPIQYVTGLALFQELFFEVNQNVLIPRTETEDLVNLLIGNVPSNASVLDIGTGSGCIPISLASVRKDVNVTGLDFSDGAIQIARRNAQKHNIDCPFIHMDILKDWPEINFDVIVSNPPYIEEFEMEEMSEHVKEYEPGSALFVPDHQPLLFYSRIMTKALNHCRQLWFECHIDHVEKVASEMKEVGFTDVSMYPDITGRLRFVSGMSNMDLHSDSN